MTNYFFDATHPLPQPGTNALVELPDAGTTFVGLDIVNATGVALMTQAKQRISIAETFKVQGNGNAVEVKGNGSAIYNDGTIQSTNGIGVHFLAAGTGFVTNYGQITGTKGIVVESANAQQPSVADKLDLYNLGTVSASGLAIQGNIGADHVTNAGLIKTTGNDASVTIIDLGAGSDFYDGTQGTVVGRIELGAGDDTAYGGVGNETFSGGPGSNYIDGGVGTADTIDYSWATASVTLSLALSGSQWIGFQSDQILNVENIIGSAQADKLTGSDVANKLQGGAGADTLEGGFGNDTLDGGDGIDTARYSGSSGVTVSLAINGAQDAGVYGSDTLIGIENLEGGSGADKLTGNDGNNTLTGGNGNDTLTGGLGNDLLDGGAGEDRAVYTGNSTAYTITSNTDGTFTIAGPEGQDILKDVRLAQFADKTIALVNGAPSSIFLSGSTISETAAPGTTIGTLFGSDPDNDTLTYSLVSNAGGLFGLNGTNLVLQGALDYETAKQYTIAVKASDAYGKDLVKAVTINVRNVVETNPLKLTGTAKQDSLVGEDGNDLIKGLGGNDTLWGQGGNDTLIGGAGNDALIGGIGKDVFVFDTKPNVRSNVDTIYGFTPVDDTIDLSRKIFSKLPKKGTLAKGAFWIGDHVHDKDDRIIYNKKTGALFYDPDGTGKASAIQIAVLSTKLKLTYHDFMVI
ncbi:cadherin domain-containing protein [Microvirga puerhi]|uniref:cadherin domain-containing protein n=1 Tax=Microvirga puerhi TaxID=2876078 RepID=UPI00272E97B8|nr:cadherin domain-containing protein [Microvirga puerhi]